MKVLLVDDEPRVVHALGRLLRLRAPRDWVVVTATSGRAALEQLDGDAADVVVSDMRMPEMDGSALLAAVRERWPDTVRLVLSGHSEPEAATRIASLAHQFFAKPVAIDELVGTLRELDGLRARTPASPLRALLRAIGDLPAAPSAYLELTAATADPRFHADDLLAIIRRDPALVAKVLQLAGSAFFTRGAPTRDLRTALARLGLRLVAALALASSAFKLHPSSGLSTDVLAAHALAAAQAAARAAPPGLADDAFVAGLLADVGLSALGCWAPDRVRTARAHATEHRVGLAEAERALFGVTHAELGAHLLALWRLPAEIVEAVAVHHEPDLPPGLGQLVRDAHAAED